MNQFPSWPQRAAEWRRLRHNLTQGADAPNHFNIAYDAHTAALNALEWDLLRHLSRLDGRDPLWHNPDALFFLREVARHSFGRERHDAFSLWHLGNSGDPAIRAVLERYR